MTEGSVRRSSVVGRRLTGDVYYRRPRHFVPPPMHEDVHAITTTPPVLPLRRGGVLTQRGDDLLQTSLASGTLS